MLQCNQCPRLGNAIYHHVVMRVDDIPRLYYQLKSCTRSRILIRTNSHCFGEESLGFEIRNLHAANSPSRTFSSGTWVNLSRFVSIAGHLSVSNPLVVADSVLWIEKYPLKISAVSTGMSFLISTLLALSLFSVMQLNSKWLTSSSALVIGSGFLGSVLFTLSLTVSFLFVHLSYVFILHGAFKRSSFMIVIALRSTGGYLVTSVGAFDIFTLPINSRNIF